GGRPGRRSSAAFPPAASLSRHSYRNFRATPSSLAKPMIVLASAIRFTALSLNSALYFAFFFFIGLLHYGRYVSPILCPDRVSLSGFTTLQAVPFSPSNPVLGFATAALGLAWVLGLSVAQFCECAFLARH